MAWRSSGRLSPDFLGGRRGHGDERRRSPQAAVTCRSIFWFQGFAFIYFAEKVLGSLVNSRAVSHEAVHVVHNRIQRWLFASTRGPFRDGFEEQIGRAHV